MHIQIIIIKNNNDTDDDDDDDNNNVNNDGNESDGNVRPFLLNMESSLVVTASDELNRVL